MALLGLGVALDLGVVADVIFQSEEAAVVVAVVAGLVSNCVWFVVPAVVRARDGGRD
jgi:hypothetical protein